MSRYSGLASLDRWVKKFLLKSVSQIMVTKPKIIFCMCISTVHGVEAGDSSQSEPVLSGDDTDRH